MVEPCTFSTIVLLLSRGAQASSPHAHHTGAIVFIPHSFVVAPTVSSGAPSTRTSSEKRTVLFKGPSGVAKYHLIGRKQARKLVSHVHGRGARGKSRGCDRAGRSGGLT